MMSPATTVGPAARLCGRALLAGIFIHEGIGKMLNYPGALAYMRAFGVPEVLLPPAIALELGCGLLLLIGLWTRPAAVLLAGFCLATAALFHVPFTDRNQLIQFEKNLAIAGGCLVLVSAGAGRFSLDARRRGRG